MPKRTHRPQKADQIDVSDTRPLEPGPVADRDDRLNNPKDLDPEVAVEHNHIDHGGMIESRAEALTERGSGGRKRSGPFGRYRAGRDLSKKR